MRWRHAAYPVAALWGVLWLDQQLGYYQAGRATCERPEAFVTAYCDADGACIPIETVIRIDGARVLQIAQSCGWTREAPQTRIYNWGASTARWAKAHQIPAYWSDND